MAPHDITNCVRRPAPAKQITPTAPRRVLKTPPEDDRTPTAAVVTPDGNSYDAWRGDPATHLPEEVFHLVLALAGGRACVGAAAVRRVWRHARRTDAAPTHARPPASARTRWKTSSGRCVAGSPRHALVRPSGVTTAQSSAGAFLRTRRGAVGVICFVGAGRRAQFVMSNGAIWSF